MEALDRASYAIGEPDLADMVLVREELPDELLEFQFAREGTLDNETMAAFGFPGNTTESTRKTGRITGYLREFVGPAPSGVLAPESNVIAATVVHMFEDRGSVSRWMTDKFVGEFRRMVGQELGPEQHLSRADEIRFDGFSDEAVGLRTLQSTSSGPVSSTIVDFRVGRLLGVAYLVTLGDVERKALVERMALEFERRIVRVLLGGI